MDNAIASLIEHWRQRARTAAHIAAPESIPLSDSVITQVIRPSSIPSEEAFSEPEVKPYPTVLVQAAIVRLGDETAEGHLIQGVSIAWFEIIRELERNPDFLFQVPWRKLEELIAGAYEREGWPEVVLTPRSRDGGRDVIATKPGIGSIRIIDQVKAYSSEHRVSADEVRAVLGVLTVERNVSKGVITTSGEFAPGILKDPGLSAFMPNRLELKDGDTLRSWLIDISTRKSPGQ